MRIFALFRGAEVSARQAGRVSDCLPEKCKKIMPVLQATFVYASLDFAKGS